VRKSEDYEQCIGVIKLGIVTGQLKEQLHSKKEKAKTFNSGYSLVVTHLTINHHFTSRNRKESFDE
jgi:hypothetical protein